MVEKGLKKWELARDMHIAEDKAKAAADAALERERVRQAVKPRRRRMVPATRKKQEDI